jgi:hypothetical protein
VISSTAPSHRRRTPLPPCGNRSAAVMRYG